MYTWDWNVRLGLNYEYGKKMQLFCGNGCNILIYSSVLMSSVTLQNILFKFKHEIERFNN